MCDKEFEITESPKHTDARHTAVLGGHDIHITVADIYGTFPSCIHLAQSLIYSIWGWLFLNILTLTYSHINQVAKEMATEGLGGSIKLIAHHGNILASILQLL